MKRIFYFKNNIMKTKIEIKSIFGEVLFTYEDENATIKKAVEKAIKEKINLSYSNLSYSDLRDSNLSYSDLRDSNLSYSDLRGSDLSGSDLRGSDLSGSNLRDSNLRGSDLRDSNLRGSDLSGSNLSGSDLSGSNLSYSNLSGSNLSGSKNKETAYIPLNCKWSFTILGDKIQIGCKEKTIKEWDLFFNSDEEFETNRSTDEFKQIQACYEACKSYLTFLNK